MSGTTFQHYNLKVWFKTKEEPMCFTVAEGAWLRFKRALDEQKKGFFICATTAGQSFALNLSHVQLAQFEIETWNVPVEVKAKSTRTTTLYLTNKEPISFQAGEPLELAQIFNSLKPNEGNEALQFTDLVGNQILFFTDELTLFETSTVYLESGYVELYRQKTGKNPPS